MDKSKREKVILIGKSGSGKDYLMRKLIEKGLKGSLKMTTRPQRKNETHLVTYNFVKESLFIDKIDKEDFLCYQKFLVTPEGRDPENWYYGLTKEEFQKSQVFIMTPGEFSNIDLETRKECFVVYLDIPRDIRESRLYKRKDKNDSIKRRLDSDDDDFLGFDDYDLKVTDHEFTADDIYDLMD
jgi:guanylate kinase